VEDTIVPQIKGKPKSAATDQVLTLAEAAEYLRVPEEQVVHFIDNEGLPARKAGTDWRLLKEAIHDWLRHAPRPKKGIWASIGTFKDDPQLEEIVKEAHRRRGRPITEDD
jgi:excisionase family DNA binding protein